MKIVKLISIVVLFLSTTLVVAQYKSSDYLSMKWEKVATKMPSEWYGSDEAKLVAENVLLAQKEIGGWEKNKDYQKKFSKSERAHYINDKSEIGATFDNGATITELRFLAKMHLHTKDECYKEAFERGVNYIFIAQYENGGWPQFYPLRSNKVDYSGYITYNDDAMVNVMKLIRDIYLDKEDFGSLQLVYEIKENAKRAFELGIECFLKTQIVVDGEPTVWCAQHDEITFAPANARSYELASFSGSESANIVMLLMGVKHPSQKVIASVEGAVKWFEDHQIEGIKLDTEIQEDGQKNRIVVADKNAPTLWARFYDLETGKPFFCDRDGVKMKTLAEIGYNRRNGYGWYTNKPEKVLKKYPEWLAKNKLTGK